MNFFVKRSTINGDAPIPGSKSHTVRALVFAALARGRSVIKSPLKSSDTLSCLKMVRGFGARVEDISGDWIVEGIRGGMKAPDDIIDVGNSGTSLYIGIGAASLADGWTFFTGDHQIRNRPADKLIESINDLGGRAFSSRSNGRPPLAVKGPITGGETTIEAVTSQYLTSLLMAAPLAAGDTRINVPLLNERPYVEMTLDWLDRLGIKYVNDDFKNFFIPGGQSYPPFERAVPADFSSAAFFLAAGALAGGEVVLKGLDFSDTQGDKAVVDILKEMGADIRIEDSSVYVKGGALKGGEFDLNAIPDALPILSVAGCFAEGETRLVNVPQARLKETDRIAVMRSELQKMGADIEERPDGLIIKHSPLKGTRVRGWDDHRVVMSLSVAGMIAEGETVIDTAESVSVTFPEFYELMRGLGAQITNGD